MQRYEKRSVTYHGRSTAEHYLSFDSFAEFIAACHKQKGLSRNLGFLGGGIDAFSGASYDTAYYYATNGYPEGVALMKMKLDALDLSSHVAKPELFFDVVGDYGFDMGLVLSGEPENAISYRPGSDYDTSKTGPIVNVLVNTVMSSGIPKDVIAHRGAAIVSLVDALENAGKRVQIDVICSAHVSNLHGIFTHAFPLKNASETLTIENIAFALAHPAIERRFNFVALDLFPKHCGWTTKETYGMPIDVAHEGYDIYVPMLHYDNPDWESIESTDAWIKRQLHAMGITLDTDSNPKP